MGTADAHLFPIHRAGDAVRHQILHLGMAFLMAQASAAGRFHYGVGHGVGEVFLQAGGQAEHLRLILAVEGDDLGHLGTGVGKGAGLIKDDGVRFGCGFQKPAALDGDVLTPGLPHGRHDCQRHRQL